MADSMLIRFEGDTSQKVRLRAKMAGKSITAFLNDAVQAYLDNLDEAERSERRQVEARYERFAERLADARHALKARGPDPVLEAIADCLELMPFGDERVVDPVAWEQFKSSRLNVSQGDAEAKRMFSQDYSEIENRDWEWYLSTWDSPEAAKRAWLRQRRRHGLPVPPPK